MRTCKKVMIKQIKNYLNNIITNKILTINNILPQIDLKIKSLNSIITKDKNNLKLLGSNPDFFIQRAAQSPTLDQVIHAYKNELLDFEAERIKLSQEKDNLESQLRNLEENNLESYEIFDLSQDFLKDHETNPKK